MSEAAREVLQVMLLDRVREAVGGEREAGRAAADAVGESVLRALLGLRLPGVEKAEPRPRSLVDEVRVTAAAVLEGDRGAAVRGSRPLHGRGADLLVAVLDRLAVEVELDAQRLGIEGRGREAEGELGLVVAAREVGLADRLGRLEPPQQRL